MLSRMVLVESNFLKVFILWRIALCKQVVDDSFMNALRVGDNKFKTLNCW